jgi:SAM-dependent methyltransferase
LAATPYTDGTYLRQNPTWHAEDAPWKARHVASFLDDLQPHTLCDVGCGAGRVLAILCERYGAEGVGYDPSPDAIDLAHELERPGLRFVVGQPGPGERYDIALLLDVLEHTENPFELLRNVRTFADQFVLHFPLDLSAQAVLRGRFERARAELGHLHYFSAETALALLRDCRFRIDRWTYLPSTLENRGETLASKLANVPRWLLWRISPTLMSRTLGGATLLVLATPAVR